MPSRSDVLQRVLELVYAGRVSRKNGFCEIPTAIFVSKIDGDMPELPEVPFYRFLGESPELIREANQPCSPLALSMHLSVWVPEEDMGIVQSFVGRMILGGVEDPVDARMESLRRSAIMVTEDLFSNPSPENINKSVKMVGSFVYVLMKDPKAYAFLSKLSSHDPYTLQHSVGAAVHCIILGRKIGVKNEKELTELGTAGLLHDIGKTKVKKEIINKNGPLDEVEWEEMRGHSSEGYDIVKNNSELSDRTKKAILEHHEDKNGTGYPHGKRLSDINVYSRVTAICDIFNALTTNRSYSKAMTPLAAFQLMREKLLHKFDDKLFRELVLIYGGKID